MGLNLNIYVSITKIGLIIMRQVIHLPTFQPPVDDAPFFALNIIAGKQQKRSVRLRNR